MQTPGQIGRCRTGERPDRDLDPRIGDHAPDLLDEAVRIRPRDQPAVEDRLRRSGDHVEAEAGVQHHGGDRVVHECVQQRVFPELSVGMFDRLMIRTQQTA